MEGNVEALERRYQDLLRDHQAGKVDEATFIAEVDKLQFKDEWGRYWMLGAQSGEWHYYDGQAWHQADPREADKLPILDSEGRYWQKGIKSGDWYYYEPETGEWVKPSNGAPHKPVLDRSSDWSDYHQPQAGYGQTQPYTSQSYLDTPSSTGQFDTQLFQDDEGRYWAIGTKTNKWYFYDHNGWHPAEEFQVRAPSQATPPQPGSFGPSSQPAPIYPAPQSGQRYLPQAQQPVYQQANPTSQQVAYPQPDAPASGAGQPAPAGASLEQMPSTPAGTSQSGSWYYFDGSQWLKYSADESAETTALEPEKIPDAPPDPKTDSAKAEVAKPSSEDKSEPVVAEYFEEEEPPVEVVDVEVITVVEPEPEPEPVVTPEPEPEPPQYKPQPEPTPEPSRTELEDHAVIPRRSDEVRGRRSRTAPVDQPLIPPRSREAEERPRRTTSSPGEPQRRMTPDPSRPVTPRQRTATQKPSVTLPASAGASSASTSSPTQIIKPQKPTQAERRRARENTVPMEPVSPTSTKTGPLPTPSSRHRQVTQSMPKVTPSGTSGASGPKTAPPAAPTTPPKAPAPQPQQATAKQTKPEKNVTTVTLDQKDQDKEERDGYTLGEVLRSLPSTLWTGVAGVAVLVIAAVLIIAGVMYGSNLFGINTVASVPNPTPTLDQGIAPAATPTPGSTSVSSAASVDTPTPASSETYVNGDLEIRLEYPETWQSKESTNRVIFSPSTEGLDFETPNDISMRISKDESNDASISDLLTSALAEFPASLETLNEGTISIASQTWTSTQIRFDSEELGGQGIATLAVSKKGDEGYSLVAVAPAEEWNLVQPHFQGMINTLEFVSETEIAQARPTSASTRRPTASTTAQAENEEEDTAAAGATAEKEEATSTPTPRPTRTPTPTPTPEIILTPLVYAVQSGDTLLEIAVKFGVDVDLLAQENGIDNPGGLQVGQELTIPYTAEELAAYNASNGTDIPSPEEAEADTDDEETDPEEDTAEEVATAETDDAETETEASAAEEEESTAPVQESASPSTSSGSSTASSEPASLSGRIVYPAHNPSIQGYDIWLYDIATGEQTPIVGNASQPAFNQDGSLLAYRSWDLGTRGIFFRDFVGGRGGIVTKFVEDALPTWSPDGYSFNFASRKEGDRVPRVYIGNVTGEEAISVGFQGEYPDTFPDGRIVSKGCTPAGDCGMFVLGARGGGETKISEDQSATAPAVSPDGGKIAYMSSAGGSKNWEIWVMNSDGSNPTRLTENRNNDGLPTWSPDGQSIAWVSDQAGWAVWVMNADGSNQRKLFDMKGSPDGKVLRDEANSKGWLEERISWAP